MAEIGGESFAETGGAASPFARRVPDLAPAGSRGAACQRSAIHQPMRECARGGRSARAQCDRAQQGKTCSHMASRNTSARRGPLPVCTRESDDVQERDATIALMAKFKPVRANPRSTPKPQGAVGCVVLIILIMFGVMAFLYLVMKSHAS